MREVVILKELDEGLGTSEAIKLFTTAFLYVVLYILRKDGMVRVRLLEDRMNLSWLDVRCCHAADHQLFLIDETASSRMACSTVGRFVVMLRLRGIVKCEYPFVAGGLISLDGTHERAAVFARCRPPNTMAFGLTNRAAVTIYVISCILAFRVGICPVALDKLKAMAEGESVYVRH